MPTAPAPQLRLAGLEEAPAIAEVLRAAFAEFEALYTPQAFAATTPTRAQIAARWHEGPVWVAVTNGRLVGTVAAVVKPVGLYVRSPNRARPQPWALAPRGRGGLRARPGLRALVSQHHPVSGPRHPTLRTSRLSALRHGPHGIVWHPAVDNGKTAAPAPRKGNAMTLEETNKAIVRRYIEAVVNQNQVDLIDELFAPEMRAQVRAHLAHGQQAFPDGQEEIRDLVAEGNTVMVRWNFHGTHRGPYLDIPATNQVIEMLGFAVYYLENGQIVDDLMLTSNYGALKQMGVTFTPPAAGTP